MTFLRSDTCRYTAPFILWMALLWILPANALAYALRALLAALLAIALYGLARDKQRPTAIACSPRNCRGSALPFGLLIGILITLFWIAPEYSDFYRTWFCGIPGSAPTPPQGPSPYEPAVCGWILTLAKLIGSAFVIAPIEEIFFRAFLYRRLQARDFTTVPHNRFNLEAFCWMILLFALEHDRWLAAAIAGAAYFLCYMRYGLASAITAHVTTNFLLALWVILRGAWQFW